MTFGRKNKVIFQETRFFNRVYETKPNFTSRICSVDFFMVHDLIEEGKMKKIPKNMF